MGLCASWILISLSFLRWGKFLAIMSSDMFSSPLSLFSFWEPCNVNISAFDIVPEISKLSLFYFILFFSFFYSRKLIFTTLSSSSLICSSLSFSPLLISSIVLSFQLFYFLFPVVVYIFILFVKTSNFLLCASIHLPSTLIIF